MNENPIKAARLRAGLTQQQLADKIGVPQHHISRWEREECAPGAKSLMKLAKALECSLDDLVQL